MSKNMCRIVDGMIYFPKKQIPKKKKVMNSLGVKKNTFAGNMVSRLYDYYFKGAVNFKSHYKKYYRKEYNSIEDYLENHFNVEKNEALIYAKGNYSRKECSVRSVERNIATLNDDHRFKEKFSNAVGGITYEDSEWICY